ncbi:MAG: PAS domain-containing sensor histidine kinase [Bacteroidetes bacterium]|nr:PAS domain-containing sensor histidine kinase [Bacteroidota bacterium]
MEKSLKDLIAETENLNIENKNLKQQLHEVLESVESENIDALVVADKKKLRILREETADEIYRLLIEKMNEGAVTLNEDGLIIYCNFCFASMLNLPLEKVIGNFFHDFIDKFSKTNFNDLLKQAQKNIVKQELFLNTAKGKLTPVQISVNILPVEDVFTLSVIVTDLTLINKKQEEIKTQKKLLEEAEKIAEIGSWTVDLKTNKVTRSNGLYLIYEWIPANKIGNFSPFELIHQSDLEASKIIFDTAVKEKGSFDTYTCINTPPDNREKTLHIKGKVISKEGEATQLIGTTQDITILKQAEQELRNSNKELTQAQEKITKLNQKLESKVITRTRELELAYERLQEYNFELEEVNKSKDRFISIISHDLRNPVSAINSSSDIIMNNFEGLQKDEIRNFSKIINSSSKKIVEQLNELVEWSKQKSKKINFNPKGLNLYDFVEFSLELIQSIADKKNIRISNNIEHHIQVNADPLLLRSIFQNLITNSIKFTPEKGEIKLDATESKSMVEISIKDTGIGMKEETQSTLFSEAEMAKAATKIEKGSGLGLILVKDFVQKHKGKIWVKSKPGKGCTFYFTLPTAE